MNLNRKILVNRVFYNIGFSKIVSENILNDIFEIFIQSLIQNDKLKISNFGTFYKKNKSQRLGRNPKTLEKKIINERIVVTFKASKKLKKIING